MISHWFGVLEFSYGGRGGWNSIFKVLMYMLKQVFCFPLWEKSTTENDYKPLNQPWIHLKDPLK